MLFTIGNETTNKVNRYGISHRSLPSPRFCHTKWLLNNWPSRDSPINTLSSSPLAVLGSLWRTSIRLKRMLCQNTSATRSRKLQRFTSDTGTISSSYIAGIHKCTSHQQHAAGHFQEMPVVSLGSTSSWNTGESSTSM
jgi:hypothetical protein